MLKDFPWWGDGKALHVETGAAVCVQVRLVVQYEMAQMAVGCTLKTGALGEKNLLDEPWALN